MYGKRFVLCIFNLKVRSISRLKLKIIVAKIIVSGRMLFPIDNVLLKASIEIVIGR